MIGYECDNCRNFNTGNPKIKISGFKPPYKGGILLPMEQLTYDFCCKECFIKWLQPNIKLEN